MAYIYRNELHINVLLFVFNLALLLAGLAVFGVTVYAAVNGSYAWPYYILYIGKSLGLLAIMTSIFGFSAMAFQCALPIYVVLIVLIIAVDITLIAVIAPFSLNEEQHAISSALWNNASDDQRSQVQDAYNCCGYLTPNDGRVVSVNCPANTNLAEEVGCAVAMEQFVHSTRTDLIVGFSVSMALSMMMLGVCVFILFRTRRRLRDREQQTSAAVMRERTESGRVVRFEMAEHEKVKDEDDCCDLLDGAIKEQGELVQGMHQVNEPYLRQTKLATE